MALLSLILVFMMIGEEYKQVIPPPLSALFKWMVVPAMVGELLRQ